MSENMAIEIFKKMWQKIPKDQNFNVPNYNFKTNKPKKASFIEKEIATRDLERFRLSQREVIETQYVCFYFPKLVPGMEEYERAQNHLMQTLVP